MWEDAASKAERYRKEANKYGEFTKLPLRRRLQNAIFVLRTASPPRGRNR
jgi:hypothetical protein